MSSSQLPERASLEYLKKLAKDRLHEMRQRDSRTQLAAALLAVARDHGFPSWRALKAAVDARRAEDVASFVEACEQGDTAAVRERLDREPGLARAVATNRSHDGWTGLHGAAQRGRLEVVRLLLERGADPNAREAGDNTHPLHWAAANRHLETVAALLDAGGDVHGLGDLHALDAIGWATYFHPHGTAIGDQPDVASFLVERGAKHHIYSAIAIGDLDLIRSLVEQNPTMLDRRMSRFEQRQTPLHLAVGLRRHDILDLLIALGADVEALDGSGRSPLAMAMLRGDRESMTRLHAAGATPSAAIPASDPGAGIAGLAGSVKKVVPMIAVPDVAATLRWYTAIGFKELGRYEDAGVVNWGMLSLGDAEVMLNAGGTRGQHDTGLWFYTDKVDELYRLLKARQLDAARAALAGEAAKPEGIEFEEDLYEPFYGGRQFSIRDLNGYSLLFLQPA